MRRPNKQRRQYIESLPSVYTEVDFINDITTVEDRAYWFQSKRIQAWLLKDTRYIIDKGDSIFGLAALVFIGIETISAFRFGDSRNYRDLGHPSQRFPLFLEQYIDTGFRTRRTGSINFRGGTVLTDPRDSQIFYYGMRNSLMHSFSFRRAALVIPLKTFKKWEPRRQILKIDARKLLIKFEDGIHKYLRDLWKAQPGDTVYDNFRDFFQDTFVN